MEAGEALIALMGGLVGICLDQVLVGFRERRVRAQARGESHTDRDLARLEAGQGELHRKLDQLMAMTASRESVARLESDVNQLGRKVAGIEGTVQYLMNQHREEGR